MIDTSVLPIVHTIENTLQYHISTEVTYPPSINFNQQHLCAQVQVSFTRPAVGGFRAW
jgi:hypothetical protein